MSIISSKQLTTTPLVWTGVLTFDTSSLGCTVTQIYNSTTGTDPTLTLSTPGQGPYELVFGNAFTTDSNHCTAYITTKSQSTYVVHYVIDFSSLTTLRIYTYDSRDNLYTPPTTIAYLKIEVYPPAV